MNWREYQEAAARLYEQADGIGTVRRNVYLPDRVTGQKRQIDVLLEIDAKGHAIRVVIDAKFHAQKLDVTDVESVLELAAAVGAHKAVIVAANGWTEPAAAKARFAGLDLLLLDLDEALELIVPDKWQICPSCERDCIIINHEGTLTIEDHYSVYMAGQCRECHFSFVWCWACGAEGHLEPGTSEVCDCGHRWSAGLGEMSVILAGASHSIPI